MLITDKRKIPQKIKDLDRQIGQLGISLFTEDEKIHFEKMYNKMIDILLKHTDIQIIKNTKNLAIGLYLIAPKRNKLPYWTAIDNFSGKCIVQDFDTKLLAIRWLLKDK